MSLKRDIRLVNAHGIFTHMLFLLPVIFPYYNSIGLTFRDFLIGEAVFSAVVLLSEVPSGWISDMWKRRSTLVLGGFFGLCGYAMLMLAEGFWMATSAQAVIGIAVALNSGTNTALLYDRLHEEGREDDYRRLDGQRHGATFYGTALSCLAGGFLFFVHPKLPLVFDMAALLGAMIAIACVREPKRFQKSAEKHVFYDVFKTMKYALTGHPEITGIILVSTVIMCTTKLMLWTQQPYYMAAGLPVIWFGVIMTASFIIGGVAGQFSHRIDRCGSNRAALGGMGVLLVLCCFALAAVTSIWFGIILFLSGTLVYAMAQPRINEGINTRIGPERRATVLSTANLMVHFLFIPASLIVGLISERGAIGDALLWIGGQLLVLGGIGLWLWGRNGRRYAASSTITGT
ncbi:MAG: MFS transporter [Micavibrio sp.]